MGAINSESKNSDRRRYVRLDGKHLVRHERFTIPRGAEVIEDAARNISEGGILFTTKMPYVLGMVLRLELKVLGIDRYKTEFYKAERLSNTEPFVVLGKVVRVEAVDGGMFDIGVSLVGLDYLYQHALARYIKAHVKS